MKSPRTSNDRSTNVWSASPNTITFREFLNVARELVTLMPEQSAIYLAALVALDMSAEDSVLFGRGEEESAN